jgi:negative regulator of replication initiation
VIAVDGALNAEEFTEAALQMSTKLRRYFTRQEDLIHVGGKTYAVTKHWEIRHIPALQRITGSNPDLKMQFVKADA